MGWTSDFPERVARRDVVVGVIGLGYVGLPTAVGFHEAGFQVRGHDVSPGVIRSIESGRIETGGELALGSGDRWRVSTDPRVIAGCDVVLVTVPTPVTADLKPDLSFVGSAGAAVFSPGFPPKC